MIKLIYSLQQNPYDLSPNYAGTIFGLSNTIANLTGFLTPMLTGLITNHNVRHFYAGLLTNISQFKSIYSFPLPANSWGLADGVPRGVWSVHHHRHSQRGLWEVWGTVVEHVLGSRSQDRQWKGGREFGEELEAMITGFTWSSLRVYLYVSAIFYFFHFLPRNNKLLGIFRQILQFVFEPRSFHY